eukprot:TRINITY_DN10771_c0_g1_i1.p4 TRINITY_DN10771_c0_g1~~TRINITY_DN10771_c0_g1_i1.p4  ORF type:complete len:140 (-),score=45.37 TRINITY_DN10771_c0_g1_i1:62-481(-)
MGRVRTKTTKRAARLIVEKYFPKLTLDFQTNKRICDEVAIVPSKRLRNKIAGYVTHLMKRIQKGPVRGISLALQEEERERRDNYVPEVSIMERLTANIEVDADTKKMLEAIDFGTLANEVTVGTMRTYRDDRRRRPRKD